jgi:hypothetical protein
LDAGDSYLTRQYLKFANTYQKSYTYYSNGRDIHADLHQLYEQNKGQETVKIGEHDVPMESLEDIKPIFEEKVAVKQYTGLTPVALRDIIDVYRNIKDSVIDDGFEHEPVGISSDEPRRERRVKDHSEDLEWLQQYTDVDGMVVADDLDYSLVGTVVDLQGIHANSRLGDSKLALVLETEGQTVLVNARGAMHRNYGYMTESRVKQLKESLPRKDIDVTSDWELKQWFDEAGIEKSAYMKAKERALQKLTEAKASFETAATDNGLITKSPSYSSELAVGE